MYTLISELSKPKVITDLYCFSYTPKKMSINKTTGWYYHNIQAEFHRQGLPNENWVMCHMNSDYQLCSTYPKCLVVPASATVELVQGSAKFRSRDRCEFVASVLYFLGIVQLSFALVPPWHT